VSRTRSDLVSWRNGNTPWADVTNQRCRYVRYWAGEAELHDLRPDSFAPDSRHRDPSLQALKAALAGRMRAWLGLAIVLIVT
jgi:hypothetical protein